MRAVQDELAQRPGAVSEFDRLRIGREQQGQQLCGDKDQERQRIELLDGRHEACDENGRAGQSATQIHYRVIEQRRYAGGRDREKRKRQPNSLSIE